MGCPGRAPNPIEIEFLATQPNASEHDGGKGQDLYTILMKCIYCQQDVQFVHGDVYICNNCPCDVEYHLGQSQSYGSRGTHIIKQLIWTASHNGSLFQVTVQPSEDSKTFTHSTIIQKLVGGKRPVLLVLNCIPWIKPGCSTEEFNYLLEMTNEHPQRGVQMPCHFCHEPLVVGAGDLELTSFQRGGIYCTCYHCRSDKQIHHAFKEVNKTYQLSSIWWDTTVNQNFYNIHLSIEIDEFYVSYTPHGSEYDEEVLRLKHIPHITPNNAEQKLLTYLLFS